MGKLFTEESHTSSIGCRESIISDVIQTTPELLQKVSSLNRLCLVVLLIIQHLTENKSKSLGSLILSLFHSQL